MQERNLLNFFNLLSNVENKYSQKYYKEAISLFNKLPEDYLAPLVKNRVVVGDIEASEVDKRFCNTRKIIEDLNERINRGELVFFNGKYISKEEKRKLVEEIRKRQKEKN